MFIYQENKNNNEEQSLNIVFNQNFPTSNPDVVISNDGESTSISINGGELSAKPEVPQINVDFDVNSLMTYVVTILVNSNDPNIAVAVDTSADNTLHTSLVQCHQENDNIVTDVKVGETNRHIFFHMDNSELFSATGFYVDTDNNVFATFTMIVQWNTIAVLATRHTSVA